MTAAPSLAAGRSKCFSHLPSGTHRRFMSSSVGFPVLLDATAALQGMARAPVAGRFLVGPDVRIRYSCWRIDWTQERLRM